MSRHDLCAAEELAPGTSRVFDLDDFRVVVARSGDRVFALEDRCSHDDGEFEEARIHPAEETRSGEAEIECPRHGGRFELASGKASQMPAIAPIEAFPAGVEDGRIWVEVTED